MSQISIFGRRLLRAVAGCAIATAASPALAAGGADVVYHHGVVITVDDSRPRAEAVAIKDGRIVGVGADREVLVRWGKGARAVDLKGRVMIPGFVDGHSHIGDLVTTWRLPDLTPAPVGTTRSIADIQRIMGDRLASAGPPADELVMGVGYDDSMLAERRHPTRADLDAVSKAQPICVVHVSGHMGRCNGAALAKFGLTRDTPDPKGGRIGHDSAGKLDGVLEETALGYVMNAAPNPSPDEAAKSFREIQVYYASQGYTTAQDGITSSPVTVKLLLDGQRDNTLLLDIASYPRWTLVDELVAKQGIHIGGRYRNHLKFAGVKITGDGSPQGKTAWLTKPYVHPPLGAQADYRGFPTVAPDEMARLYDTFIGRGWQVQTHCNGDACIDSVLAAIQGAYARHPEALATRPVMIHAQTTRADQLEAYARLGIFPSFFAEHTYYWGDWHRAETLGPERGAYISPTADALKNGVRFSLHTDAPVVPPSALHAMWSAVNRVTRSGFPLGPDQRVSPMDALRALTIWPAWQHFDEKTRGSISVGKQADLVVLDANPLTVEPMAIRNIRVLTTIKAGQEIYRRGVTEVARVPFAAER